MRMNRRTKRRSKRRGRASSRRTKRRVSRRRNPFSFFKRKRRSSRRKRRNPIFTMRKRSNRRKRKSSRRRRNPAFNMRRAFSVKRISRGASIVGGLAAGAVGKQVVGRMVQNEWLDRLYGLLPLVGGTFMNVTSRNKNMKNVGTGMVAYSILDLIVSNVPQIAVFLPAIAAPSGIMPAQVSGGMDYGRSVGTGNLLADQPAQVVGSSIESGVPAEVVGHYDGDDYGIGNLL